MAIEITANGSTNEFRCYPLDPIYVNNTQVKEVWVNGVKCYPDIEADFRINLIFASSPHWFDKSDLAPSSQIINDRSYYSRLLNVDPSQWIISEMSVSTYNPPMHLAGQKTNYVITKSIVFPNNFQSDSSTQKFAFSLDGYWVEKGYIDYSYHIIHWPTYDELGNYDEHYYYGVTNALHSTRYYLHNGLVKPFIASNVKYGKYSGESLYVSTILNASRSYEFYTFKNGDYPSANNRPRLVAEYGGGLTVHEGDITATNVSAAGEVSALLSHTPRSVLPTYSSRW